MRMKCSTLAFLLVLAATSSVVAQSKTEWLKKYDKNGNGSIDPGEITDRRAKYYFERMARHARLDPGKSISLSKLEEGMRSADRDRGDRDRKDRDRRDRDRRDRDRRDRDRNDSKSSSPKEEDGTTVPGFDVEATEESTQTVPGFDINIDAASGINTKYISKLRLEDMYEDYVLKYVDRSILQYYDRNKNQILEPDEVKRVKWSDDYKQDDANKDGRLTRRELAARTARRWGKGRKKTSVGGASAKDLSKYRDHARSLIRQYDKNKNGFLEKEEWSRMSSFARGSDRNKDGIISLDELAARLGSYGDSSSKSSSSYRSSRYSSSKSKRGWRLKANPDKFSGRKSYKSRSATELLPDGLPKWFARKDANADGQVAMSEYSSNWNTTELEEYKKFDRNGDGFITPQEVLEVEKE